MGGTPGEVAAYRAGRLDARVLAMEKHAETVNGSIATTGAALQALVLVVNDVKAAVDQLNREGLVVRVGALEETKSTAAGVAVYKRWLFSAALSFVAAVTALLATGHLPF